MPRLSSLAIIDEILATKIYQKQLSPTVAARITLCDGLEDLGTIDLSSPTPDLSARRTADLPMRLLLTMTDVNIQERREKN